MDKATSAVDPIADMLAEIMRTNMLHALRLAEVRGFDEARAWIETRLALYLASQSSKRA